jgi:prepilin-type N-terminal cleavage/methylation domain-containing protein
MLNDNKDEPLHMPNHHPPTRAMYIVDDHGFTLIELLVAMLTGVIVTGALFTILIISMNETTLISDKVQANQTGRTAMTRIVDELHSACFASGYKPIQEKSGENELIFRNAYSSEAVIPNAKEAKTTGTGAFEHQIVWSSSAKTLTDYTYKSTSGEGSEVKFPEITSTHANATPTSGVLLASNVTQTEEAGKKIPIFQYYKYAEEATGSSTTPESTLTLIEHFVPLKAETESGSKEEKENSTEKVASVMISFRESPVDGKKERDQFVDFSNQVTFAFSAPNIETPIKDTPCE